MHIQKEEPAYRLYPSENSEVCPNTTMPSLLIFLKSAKMFLKSLLLQGVQIGSSKKKRWKPIRI
jgi:hypothetical protein